MTEKELKRRQRYDAMQERPSTEAMRTGRRKPWHLLYAEKKYGEMRMEPN